MNKYKDKSILLTITLLVLFSLVTFIKQKDRILFKGQVNKQFHSHSITESLKDNLFAITQTTVPCNNPKTGETPRSWAEEPPMFHFFSAFLKNVGIQTPSAFPLLVSLFNIVMIILLASQVSPAANSIKISLTTLLVFFTPVFSRYQLQHMPDTFALLLFLTGFYIFLKGKKPLSFLFFILAVTQKALLIFALFPLLLPAFMPIAEFKLKFHQDFISKFALKALIKTLVLSLICIVPFILWLLHLENKGVPAPFSFASSLENRHSGTFHHLFELKYWSRLLRWWIPKGIGVPLFFGCVYAFYTHIKQRVGFTKPQMMMVLWALGVFPYWILVRESNFIHDYYFLSFFFPWAWLGAQGLLLFPVKNLKYALIIMSVVLGMKEGFSLQEVAKEHTEPPKFCNAETKSY